MSNLNADTLKLIQDTAQEAAGASDKVQFVPLPGEPNHVYASVAADGQWAKHVADPQPRVHTLATLFEVISYANSKGTKDNSVVWYDENGMVVILDDATRRDKAVMSLIGTPEFLLLQGIAADNLTYTQKEFRRLLKVDLHDARPNDVLLDWVSACQFDTRGMTSGVIAKDKSSFGKDIEHQVASKNQTECPEEIALSVCVFTDPGLREKRRILCAVEVHLAEQQFEIIPYPGEIQRAVDAELTFIESLMTGAKGIQCPVFRGRP